jgi:UDP-N-acetylglucosamine transferase subunit ALG13
MPAPVDHAIFTIWHFIWAVIITGGGGGAIITWWLTKKKRPIVQPHEIKKELDDHKADDDKKFVEMKRMTQESESRIIDALKENIGYIREDMKTERESTEKKIAFLEKVFLDSRLSK